jgi:hypothetical protein
MKKGRRDSPGKKEIGGGHKALKDQQTWRPLASNLHQRLHHVK